MGRAKELLIEREHHERNCPKCGNVVWVDWKNSPNVICKGCGFVGDVNQCENCQNLIPVSSDEIVCDDCFKQAMNKD